MDTEGKVLSCIDCGAKACEANGKAHPGFCVSKGLPDEERRMAISEYMDNEENMRIMCASAEVECDFYCRATRVEETVRWLRRIGAKKAGIATCVGLLGESRTLAAILRRNGFEVFGIGCKAGEVPKAELGLPKRCEAVGINICNPILQAQLLNREKTDANIVMGLCVGHDSLFYKYSKAPVTTLVVKDRVLGHNPVAALNTASSYYCTLYDIRED